MSETGGPGPHQYGDKALCQGTPQQGTPQCGGHVALYGFRGGMHANFPPFLHAQQEKTVKHSQCSEGQPTNIISHTLSKCPVGAALLGWGYPMCNCKRQRRGRNKPLVHYLFCDLTYAC